MITRPYCFSRKIGQAACVTRKAPIQVHAVEEVPIIRRHLLKACVPENPGVVDDNIDRAKGVERGLDNPVAILDRVMVGNRLAAESLDLRHDGISGAG